MERWVAKFVAAGILVPTKTGGGAPGSSNRYVLQLGPLIALSDGAVTFNELLNSEIPDYSKYQTTIVCTTETGDTVSGTGGTLSKTDDNMPVTDGTVSKSPDSVPHEPVTNLSVNQDGNIGRHSTFCREGNYPWELPPDRDEKALLIVDAWNDVVLPYGLPVVGIEAVSTPSMRAALDQAADYNGFGRIMQAIDKYIDSDFLRGKNAKIDKGLEWLLGDQANIAKVLSDKFKNKEPSKTLDGARFRSLATAIAGVCVWRHRFGHPLERTFADWGRYLERSYEPKFGRPRDWGTRRPWPGTGD